MNVYESKIVRDVLKRRIKSLKDKGKITEANDLEKDLIEIVQSEIYISIEKNDTTFSDKIKGREFNKS